MNQLKYFYRHKDWQNTRQKFKKMDKECKL